MENSFDKIKVKKKIGQKDAKEIWINCNKMNQWKNKYLLPSLFFLRFQMDADFQKTIWIPAFSSLGITDLVKYHIWITPQFLKMWNFHVGAPTDTWPHRILTYSWSAETGKWRPNCWHPSMHYSSTTLPLSEQSVLDHPYHQDKPKDVPNKYDSLTEASIIQLSKWQNHSPNKNWEPFFTFSPFLQLHSVFISSLKGTWRSINQVIFLQWCKGFTKHLTAAHNRTNYGRVRNCRKTAHSEPTVWKHDLN